MNNRSDIDALEQRLARAWRSGDEAPPLGDDWRDGVMEAVHGKHLHGLRPMESRGDAPSIEFVIRNGLLAATAAALLTALFVAINGFDPSAQIVQMINLDPEILLTLALFS